MLIDEIQTRVKQAMREKNTLERDVLRVALGDIQSEAARRGGELSDGDAQKVVRKMVKSLQETIDILDSRGGEDAAIDKARAERAVLESLLPQTLSPDQIEAALAPVADAVKAAGNDGQATGIAMKHLKATGAQVDGKDVAAVVGKIRR